MVPPGLKDRRKAIGPIAISGPAGATGPRQRNCCPCRSVGRETFRSAAECSAFGLAASEMSLWLPDRNSKTAATDFKVATKGPRDPSTSEASARGTERRCALLHSTTRPLYSLMHANASLGARAVCRPQRAPGGDIDTSLWDPKGRCWSSGG
jgi:hypothetical protein